VWRSCLVKPNAEMVLPLTLGLPNLADTVLYWIASRPGRPLLVQDRFHAVGRIWAVNVWRQGQDGGSVDVGKEKASGGGCQILDRSWGSCVKLVCVIATMERRQPIYTRG
jgi:hypothetical protein